MEWNGKENGKYYSGFRVGMEKKMETTIMGYIGTSIRVRSFIPS